MLFSLLLNSVHILVMKSLLLHLYVLKDHSCKALIILNTWCSSREQENTRNIRMCKHAPCKQPVQPSLLRRLLWDLREEPGAPGQGCLLEMHCRDQGAEGLRLEGVLCPLRVRGNLCGSAACGGRVGRCSCFPIPAGLEHGCCLLS